MDAEARIALLKAAVLHAQLAAAAPSTVDECRRCAVCLGYRSAFEALLHAFHDDPDCSLPRALGIAEAAMQRGRERAAS